jgi:hypothetical protein
MPTILTINLDGSAKAVITGFGEQDIRIWTILSGNASCDLTGSPENIMMELSGSSILTATGNTDLLYGSISGQSKANTYDLHSNVVEINTTGQSKAFVFPKTNLIVNAADQSEIYYKGNPVNTDLLTSGQAKIIKQ